jgi:antitoxin component YwqK of YwqJK toxin-antitoxin module
MTGPTESTDAIAHFPNGRVKFTGQRLDGEMHGDWTWYRTDGSLLRTGSFDRGRQIGKWRTYDRSNEVIKETTFDQGG